MLVSKYQSGTSKTKDGQGALVRVDLFCKSYCATCSPACVFLYHVTGSCEGSIKTVFKLNFLWRFILRFYLRIFNFPQIFQGNTDMDTVVYHDLYPIIKTRYIRVRPTEWYGHISMGMELYTCQGKLKLHEVFFRCKLF